MVKRLLVGLVLAMSPLLATQTPAHAVIDGAPDGSGHPYVGVVFNQDGACSGSAISSTLLLTAAHCAGFGSDVWVSFAQQPTLGTDGWPVSGPGPGLYHGTLTPIADYCGIDETCPPSVIGFGQPLDVALVHLDTPVTLPRYAHLPVLGLVDTLPAAQPVTLVGYGVTTFLRGGGTPVGSTDFVRRTTPATLLVAPPQIDDYFLRTQAVRHQICFGDSGGPVLLGDTVVAVNSFVNGMCTPASFAARTDVPEVLNAIP